MPRDLETKALTRVLLNNKKAFILNNIMRMRELIRYGTPKFRELFQKVPSLLQLNRPRTPGYIKGADSARGVYGFERSGFIRLYRADHRDEEIVQALQVRPCIQSLMLIGSVGSVGHTSSSDLDYWVLVDRRTLTPTDFTNLEKKLKSISQWAEKDLGLETHFFLMDINDIANNRVGELDEESSGDVMPLLLKEEFYRTVLHVVGRMPLWWALPVETNEESYKRISTSLESLQSISFEPFDYVDLGFVSRPGPREYLGAAMWQAYKSQKDPFKAVLKMILILEQVESDLNAPLLCDQVKAAILDSQPDQFPIDPYRLTINRVIFFSHRKLLQSEELVRVSAWFKLYGPIGAGPPAPETPKAKILKDLALQWGWSEEKVRDLQNYSGWPTKRKLVLGEEIKSLLLDLYSRIAARLRMDYPLEVLVQDENMTRLNAQILARYGIHESKVEDLPSAFDREGLAAKLHIIRGPDKWRVVQTQEISGGGLFSAARAARVAAWLHNNHLWHPGINPVIIPGISPMKARAMIGLLTILAQAFPPIQLNTVKDPTLLSKAVGPRVLVVNMEEPSGETKAITAELIYRTTLGEMNHQVLTLPTGVRESEKYFSLISQTYSIDPSGQFSIQFFVPPGQAQEDILINLRTAHNQFLKKLDSGRGTPWPKSKLDRD